MDVVADSEKIAIPTWPYAYGGPSGQGVLRASPEDFVVTEELSFVPSGAGEHVFVKIQKTSENTEYVARLLARFANVRQRDVSFAGLKDRHAVTTQWFSIWLPGKPMPDWSQLAAANIQILDVLRHTKKLRRGVIAANHFNIVIRDWQGDLVRTEQQLQAIQHLGVPNYFGEQRFGHAGQNVTQALRLFAGAKVKREQRSMYLSAARAFLFNQLLSLRVAEANWNQALPGDVFILNGSHSFFKADAAQEALLNQRLASMDIHPSGILYGAGQTEVSDTVAAIEDSVLARYPEITQGLLQEQLEQDRRPLRVAVLDLAWQQLTPNALAIQFSLPAGSYATAVIREIIAGH